MLRCPSAILDRRLAEAFPARLPFSCPFAAPSSGKWQEGAAQSEAQNRSILAATMPDPRPAEAEKDGQVAHCTVPARSRHAQEMSADFGIRHAPVTEVTGTKSMKHSAAM
jgi:hypothetical protein